MLVLPARNALHTGQVSVYIDGYSSRLPPAHLDDRQWLPASLMPRVGAFRPVETVRSTAISHAPPDRRCPNDSTDARCAYGQPCCRARALDFPSSVHCSRPVQTTSKRLGNRPPAHGHSLTIYINRRVPRGRSVASPVVDDGAVSGAIPHIYACSSK